MEGFCRSCLVKYDEPTDLIPYSEKNRRMFVYATGLQAKRNDTFTFQLCKECHLNMKVACNFKKTSRNSDKKFKNYIALKEAGDSTDFCTFLKNNDESLKLRQFPMYNGSSTPANRNRDDDNESTCTSIQNFMTDILKAEEIPDSEARIIKEVMEEEADILEDSLDSHWLQDDVSLDTDFRLDFSFSPSSTPRSTNEDHCYTPRRLNDPTALHQNENSATVKLEQEIVEQNNAFDNFNTDTMLRENETLKDNFKGGGKCVVDKNLEDALKNDAIDNFNTDTMHKEYETVKDNFKGGDKCVVDENLEDALKNDSTDKVMLDELLATPPVIPNISAPSTPLINQILFGDKKIDSDDRQKNVYMPKDMIKESEIDVLYEFFESKDEKAEIMDEYPIDYDDVIFEQEDINENNHTNHATLSETTNKPDENKDDVTKVTREPVSPVENEYCLEKCLCKICDRKFKNLLALKVHCRKKHEIRIGRANKRVLRRMICDYCGKIFASPQCITKHIQNHMKPSQFDCDHCPLAFDTERALKAHRSTHGIVVQRKENSKKYVCNVCGATLSSSSNYQIHLRRHENKYSKSCSVCGMGFYRTSDLDTHMRKHTGERPYACMYCPSKFARQDSLNRHIKSHTGEKPYHCPFCNDKFIYASILKKHQMSNITCLEKQMEVLQETSETNTMDKVTVFYTEVSNKPINLAGLNIDGVVTQETADEVTVPVTS